MPTKTQQRKARLQRKRASDMPALALEDSKTVPPASPSTSALIPDQATENVPTKDENFGIPRETVVQKANEIWKMLKAYIITNPEFKSLKDQDKMELFRTQFGYSMFMDEFPVVSRYMVCHGQFSSKAFDRMLRKVEKTVHPPPDQREQGYMEDQWVRRQADYVRYLWESYQKRHYDVAESQWVWKSTYDNLKKEFDDFRNMHKEIEERVKNEKKTFAGQNARDLLTRLASGEHNLNTDEEEVLLNELKRVFERKNNPDIQNPENPTNQVNQEYDFNNQKDPKILMIETVDAERMGEIDDKYKSKEFQSMEPIQESPESQESQDLNDGEVISEEVLDD